MIGNLSNLVLTVHAAEAAEAVTEAATETATEAAKKGLALLGSQIVENAGFLMVVVLITAVIIVAARFAELRFLHTTMNKVSRTKYITICGMFGALAGLLMLIEIPMVFLAPSFYKLDFSEVPVLVGGMYLGPVGAVIIELVKILLKLVLKGTTTAFVGDFANFAVGCSLVLPAVIIYHTKKNRKRALIGLLAGTVVITVFGTLFNALYLLPAFSKLYGMPLDVIISMGTAINPRISNVTTFVIFAVGPLNLVKGLLVSLVTMLIYKYISKFLHGLMN